MKESEEKIEHITCRVKKMKDDEPSFILQPQYIDEISDSIIEVLEDDSKRELLHARIMVSKVVDSSLLVVVSKCLSVMLMVSYERILQSIKDDVELVSKIRYAISHEDKEFFQKNKDIIFGGEVVSDDHIISNGMKVGNTRSSRKMLREVSRAYLSISESDQLDVYALDKEGLSQLSAPQAAVKKLVPDSYFKKIYESFFPEQMKIYKSIIRPVDDKKYAIYITTGTAGSGKSVLSCAAFMFKLNELYIQAITTSTPVKTLSVFIFGRTLQSIHNTIIPTMVRWFPLIKSPHRNATYIVIGGIVVSFISLDSVSSVENIRGSNAHLCYIDEATSMRNSDLVAILTRLRSSVGNFHPQFIMSSNYSFKRSVPAQIEQNADQLGASVHHIQAHTNPYLTDGFVKRLSASIDKNSIGYRIHVLGEHVDVQGYNNIYNLSESSIVEKTQPLTSSTYTTHVYIGVDVGSTNPLVYVSLALFNYFSPDKKCLCQVVDMLYYQKYHSQYVTREAYDSDLTLFVNQFASETKVTIVFPHDAVDKFHHYRRLLSSNRIEVIKAKGESVMLGIAKIKYLLSHGILEISSKAEALINEFHNYSYETKSMSSSSTEFDRNPLEGKPKKEDDHCLDALRYAVEASGIMNKVIDKIDDCGLSGNKQKTEKTILDALTI